MKRTLLSLLIAGVFAGAGTSAIAQNVTAEDQAPAAAKQTAPAKENVTDKAKSGDSYNAATTKAQATFTAANLKCDAMQGAEKTTCVSAAETARTKSLAEAEKDWNSQNDQQSMNEGEDQPGDQAANQEGMTAPEDGAAATGTDKKRQTGQAGSQDGMTSDDRAEANPEEQDPDRTAATESAAPSSQF